MPFDLTGAAFAMALQPSGTVPGPLLGRAVLLTVVAARPASGIEDEGLDVMGGRKRG